MEDRRGANNEMSGQIWKKVENRKADETRIKETGGEREKEREKEIDEKTNDRGRESDSENNSKKGKKVR